MSADGTRRWWLLYFCVFATPAVLLPVVPAAVRPPLVLVCAVAVLTALLTGIRRYRPVNALGWYALTVAIGTVLVVSLVAPMLDGAGVLSRSPVFDAIYYLSYPVYGLALTVLPTRGRPGSRFAGLTEVGILTTGAVVVWWAFVVDPVLMDSGPRITQVHVLVYPILDVAVFALGLRLLILAGFSSPAFTGLTVSTAAVLIGDVLVFVLSDDGPVVGAPPVAAGSLWLFAYALVGAAALHPSMARPAPAATDGDEPDAIGAARIYIVTVLATPVLAGVFLLQRTVRRRPGHARHRGAGRRHRPDRRPGRRPDAAARPARPATGGGPAGVAQRRGTPAGRTAPPGPARPADRAAEPARCSTTRSPPRWPPTGPARCSCSTSTASRTSTTASATPLGDELLGHPGRTGCVELLDAGRLVARLAATSSRCC